MTLFISMIGVVVGFLFVWKSEWILEQFGRVDWAEQKLASSGGTRMFWKLFGLGIILASLFYLSGILQGIVSFIFLPRSRT